MADNTFDVEICNHKSILKNIDPWMDGKAGERIGIYLFDYLSALEFCESVESAREFANSKYAQKWGNSFVINNDFD